MSDEQSFLDKAKGIADDIAEKAKPAVDKAVVTAGELLEKAKDLLSKKDDGARGA